MVSQETLMLAVRAVLGADSIAPQAAAHDYAVDGLMPKLVLLPRTVQEVADAMRVLSSHGAAVIPWGGGSAMRLGNPPLRYDVALSLTHLNRVLEYEPSDLTVTVEAGITLHELQAHLGQHGQLLPYDPPYTDRATVGGILATGMAGPLRYTYGSVVDRVLGVRIVHADGRISKAGGKVVKNVAGYEMTKLYVGSLGTLGIIVEATFKIAPLPKVVKTVAVSFGDGDDAARLAFAVRDLGLSARAIELLAGEPRLMPDLKGPYAVAIDLAGSTAGVERSLAEVERLSREFGAQDAARMETVDEQERLWEVVGNLCGPSPDDGDLVVKLNVLPTQVASLVKALLAEDQASQSVISHVALGNVFARWRGLAGESGLSLARDVLARAQANVTSLGGTLVVVSCPLALKAEIDVWGEPRGDFPLMQQIKQQMDPDGVLNPGRFIGRL